jgi:hypothetical protein
MISTHHIHGTCTVTIRGKEVVKPVLMLDCSQPMMGFDLNGQLLHSHLIQRKLFRGLFNTSILDYIIMYKNNHEE